MVSEEVKELARKEDALRTTHTPKGVTKKELLELLMNYPDDAIVVVECCNFDKLEYEAGIQFNGEPAIIITKKALEEWRDHYLKTADEQRRKAECDAAYFGIFIGKADTLIDILKHFD
ncbi:unnamed protein product [Cylicocyclus nassatus]|uniref:Uncharacterized protein n=1 Tax=Cylicocyclus nassatus TaxID=53992 RepID=A0AA36GYZ6_CYLNA|nr:unnamed protein product [Cylicocyclus nassatus]